MMNKLATLLLLALGFGLGFLLGNLPNDRAEVPVDVPSQRDYQQTYPDWSEPTPAPTATPTPTPVPTLAPAPAQDIQVHLTYYTCPPFCIGDTMANGQPLRNGAVACGSALEMGQRFSFNGREYVCEDTGASWNPVYWVDFWQPTDAIGRW